MNDVAGDINAAQLLLCHSLHRLVMLINKEVL